MCVLLGNPDTAVRAGARGQRAARYEPMRVRAAGHGNARPIPEAWSRQVVVSGNGPGETGCRQTTAAVPRGGPREVIA